MLPFQAAAASFARNSTEAPGDWCTATDQNGKGGLWRSFGARTRGELDSAAQGVAKDDVHYTHEAHEAHQGSSLCFQVHLTWPMVLPTKPRSQRFGSACVHMQTLATSLQDGPMGSCGHWSRTWSCMHALDNWAKRKQAGCMGSIQVDAPCVHGDMVCTQHLDVASYLANCARLVPQA